MIIFNTDRVCVVHFYSQLRNVNCKSWIHLIYYLQVNCQVTLDSRNNSYEMSKLVGRKSCSGRYQMKELKSHHPIKYKEACNKAKATPHATHCWCQKNNIRSLKISNFCFIYQRYFTIPHFLEYFLTSQNFNLKHKIYLKVSIVSDRYIRFITFYHLQQPDPHPSLFWTWVGETGTTNGKFVFLSVHTTHCVKGAAQWFAQPV